MDALPTWRSLRRSRYQEIALLQTYNRQRSVPSRQYGLCILKPYCSGTFDETCIRGRAIEPLELLDWRREVAELYRELRGHRPDSGTLAWFRRQKDTLLRGHPQSPIPPAQRAAFRGLSYWPFAPDVRVVARVEPLDSEELELRTSGSQGMRFSRIGRLTFELGGRRYSLDAYWFDDYAGGLFVPFRDLTCGTETYDGGRYVVDTAKGVDLGSDARSRSVVIDFNYAYHPSCAYDERWLCPLAPPANWLDASIPAGERL